MHTNTWREMYTDTDGDAHTQRRTLMHMYTHRETLVHTSTERVAHAHRRRAYREIHANRIATSGNLKKPQVCRPWLLWATSTTLIFVGKATQW